MTERSGDHDDLWQRAASFAARAHQHVIRKDGVTPYSAHPFRVAMTVRHTFACDDAVAIAAALLHDVIEDTGHDYDDIEKHFGVEIADIVAALTKNMILREDIREPEYDNRLAEADWRARLVKLADQYDNLSDAMASRFKTSRSLAKCARAIALATPDAERHPEARRAIARLEELMDKAREG